MTRWILVLTALVLAACSNKAAEDEFDLDGAGIQETRQEDGTIKKEYDIDDDGKVDVVKYEKEIPDAEDPSILKRVLIRKEVDVNSDGNFNMIRHYSEEGDFLREEVDVDLDGQIDIINHLDNGSIAKKELIAKGAEVPHATRYYSKGKIVRVEKDTSGDQKVDYWEFYEQGVLDRIGRDLNGDGRADTWQTR